MTLLLSLSISFFGVNAAQSNEFVGPPILEKVFMNSDSMQAVLFWTPSHSSVGNPIYDYAATTDGKNFQALGVGYQKKYATVLQLPTRINKTTYFFAVAPILKSGIGPVSNVLTGELSAYVVPIQIEKVTSLIDGFYFDIADVQQPGYSSSYVQFFVSDIYGSPGAYVQSGDYPGRFEIRGMKSGEIATATVYKKVLLCQGYLVSLSCPYSTTTFVKGESLKQLEAPKFGPVKSLSDGFASSVVNFDSKLSYTIDAKDGITASVESNGDVEVHGMAPASSASVLVTVSYDGYLSATATLTGKSLDSAYELKLGQTKKTNSGFNVQITNYDPKFVYKLYATTGNVSVNKKGLITVTGLKTGEFSTLRIEVYLDSKIILQTEVNGQSLNKKILIKR